MTHDVAGPSVASDGSPTIAYRVVAASSAKALETEVSLLIAQGYLPIGGVSVAVLHREWENELKGYTESDTGWEYSQAMLRQ
jgi:hypothetical protein